MDPRMREDNGRGSRGGGRFANRPYEGTGGRVRGSPPSPVLTRAGSNLPPSRGKGFVGVERAIFLVMTCGWPRCLRVARGDGDRDGSPHPRGQREGGVGGGRFPNRPYEGLVAQHITGDHKGRPYGRKGWGKGDGSPHPRGQREGESGAGGSRTAPTKGLVAQHITGDHKGRPYRRRMAGWGKGNGSPHSRGQREGESGAGGSQTAPTRGWSHSI